MHELSHGWIIMYKDKLTTFQRLLKRRPTTTICQTKGLRYLIVWFSNILIMMTTFVFYFVSVIYLIGLVRCCAIIDNKHYPTLCRLHQYFCRFIEWDTKVCVLERILMIYILMKYFCFPTEILIKYVHVQFCVHRFVSSFWFSKLKIWGISW